MKSLLILLSTFLSLALVGCKEGTIVYDIEFPRADSDEAQPLPPNVRLSAASSSFAENAGTVSISAALNKVSKSASTTTIESLLEKDGEAGKSLLTAKSVHNVVPPDLNVPPGFSAIHTVFWRSKTLGLSSLRYPLELLDSGGLISLRTISSRQALISIHTEIFQKIT